MSPKKIGVKGKPIKSQGREIIYKCMGFMANEAENGLQIPLANYRERVIAATGVSRSTYQRILGEGTQVGYNVASTSFSSPGKKRLRKSMLTEISPGAMEQIKTIIYEFYIIEKKRPTLRTILQKIRDCQVDFNGEYTTLRLLLKKIGFRWVKTQGSRQALMERHDIRLKRIEYLKNIIQYRAEGRNIVYNLHSSHTQPKGWSDGSDKELKKPIAKRRRLVIVHAGGELGFVPNALLIFKSGSKSGDYHDNMNHVNFMRWVESQLIPNLPERSVLVIDNASYHNVTKEENVTSLSLKKDMIKWLQEKDIEFAESLTKPELYKIILSNKDKLSKEYILDSVMEQHGHKVLRLPPYHPELNPIEKISTQVKNWVTTSNTTFHLADVEKLARTRFDQIGVEEWGKICSHVVKYENEQIQREHLLDDALDDICVTVNTGSSDDDEELLSDPESDLEVQPDSFSDSD